MSRMKIILVLSLSFALVATMACKPGNEAEVAALTARVDALEKRIQTLGSGSGGAALEEEAKSAFVGIQALVSSGKLDEAKAKLASYGTEYAGTKLGRNLNTLAKELAVVGKKAPEDWAIQKWYQGQDQIDLASNDTTVVVFWETWCPHCRREVPKLQEMYSQYKDDGLQVIGVTRLTKSSTDQTVQDFLAQNPVDYPMAKVADSLATFFSIAGIPAAAVVKGGKVVWRGHPVRISDQMLKNWLAS